MTGFATSVIACKCEAAIERELLPRVTPDGRPGISVLLFATDSDGLQKRLVERIGQTVLTCPTTACFDGLPDAPERMPVGKPLRIFGDGFQSSKVIAGRRYWRIPVMEGEFLVQEDFGKAKGIGGGNFLILGESGEAALAAAEAAVEAIAGMPGVILPFPGGIVRSGSKVGAKRYKTMVASTNDAYAPTIRPITASDLGDGVNSVLEIVLDGLDFESIAAAMRPAFRRMQARCAAHHGRQLRRKAGPAPLPSAQDPRRRPLPRRGARTSSGTRRTLIVTRHQAMSGAVTLTLKDAIEGRVVADSIVPDQFATLSATEIAN